VTVPLLLVWRVTVVEEDSVREEEMVVWEAALAALEEFTASAAAVTTKVMASRACAAAVTGRVANVAFSRALGKTAALSTAVEAREAP